MNILIALAAAAAPATATPPAYPELATEALLPIIVSELRRTLPDPYSIRDFTICPPARVKVRDGKPVDWYISLAFNSKNSLGGYTGYATYAAIFRNGRIRWGINPTGFAKRDGIEGLLNASAARYYIEKCTAIPDETIQDLLKPGAAAR